MLFQRVKPLDKILETAEKKALKRQLGAFQLTFLTVGIMAMLAAAIFLQLSPQDGRKPKANSEHELEH